VPWEKQSADGSGVWCTGTVIEEGEWRTQNVPCWISQHPGECGRRGRQQTLRREFNKSARTAERLRLPWPLATKAARHTTGHDKTKPRSFETMYSQLLSSTLTLASSTSQARQPTATTEAPVTLPPSHVTTRSGEQPAKQRVQRSTGHTSHISTRQHAQWGAAGPGGYSNQINQGPPWQGGGCTPFAPPDPAQLSSDAESQSGPEGERGTPGNPSPGPG